jgi:YHS domain-containing protein
MTVDPATAPASLTRAGTTRYFCSAGCRDAYAEDVHTAQERPVRTDHGRPTTTRPAEREVDRAVGQIAGARPGQSPESH